MYLFEYKYVNKRLKKLPKPVLRLLFLLAIPLELIGGTVAFGFPTAWENAQEYWATAKYGFYEDRPDLMNILRRVNNASYKWRRKRDEDDYYYE